jgi:hypothetical protein
MPERNGERLTVKLAKGEPKINRKKSGRKRSTPPGRK